MKTVFFPILLLLTTPSWAAETPVLELRMEQVQAETLSSSPRLRALKKEAEALDRSRQSRLSSSSPKLSLDGNWKYVSEIASISPGGGAPIQLGDNVNYSVGPALNWLIWDFRSTRHGWIGAGHALESKQEEIRLTEKQLKLQSRMVYFQILMEMERLRSLSDALKLANTQHSDIELRHKAGTAGRMDLLSAHQEVLTRQRQFRQAQADLAVTVRELFFLTGRRTDTDASFPMEESLARSLPPGAEPPTLLLKLDSIDSLMKALSIQWRAAPDPAPPQVRVHSEMARSHESAARSLSSDRWPKFHLSAKTSLDYPNGPKLETIHQNTVGIMASLPLIDGRRIRSDIEVQEAQSRAAEERGTLGEREFRKAWDQTHDRLAGLSAQKRIDLQSVEETAELARLTYESYQMGRSNFIEVQNANLRALEARVQSARTDVQILMQLATLAHYSGKDE
ncbi:MAG TPA: TolC family protein [Elusimicrobiota bacterium]|nr:TolC family protein [Elusimicrobiota bacterium]